MFPHSLPPGVSRPETLRRFLARDYLCPYAAVGVTSGAGVFLDLHWTFSGEREVGRALLRLARARAPGAALALVAQEDAPTWLALRAATERVLRLLWGHAVRAGDPRARDAEVRAEVDRLVGETLSERSTRPFLTVAGEPLFLVTLGASYPERHTRHAPHDCWVLTRVSEVTETALRQPAGVMAIRSQILARMGVLYDADEPLVPPSAMRPG